MRLFREPAFTLAATVVLALGMGATTAIFTLIRGIVLEPLAYPESNRLVYVWTTLPVAGGGDDVLSADDFWDFHNQNRIFSKTAGYVRNMWNATGVGDPVHLAGMMVTADFFDALDVHPAIGRAFYADEFRLGKDAEAIFSYQFWRTRLGGDPNVVGRRIALDGSPYEVVGVMPADFPMADDYDVWVPLARDTKIVRGRSIQSMRTFGRLAPGIDLERARKEASAMAADFAARYPEDRQHSFKLTTFLEHQIGSARESLWYLAAGVACLLLIACANVASLLLARSAARMREMAVRAAIGGSRAALIRQALAESTMLAILGGILGAAIAAGSVRLLLAIAPEALPRSQDVRLNLTVFGFAFALALITGIACGLAPAWRGSKLNLVEVLKESGRSGAGARGQRFRASLVVTQVAFGVVILAAAGMVARSLRALSEVRPGYDTRNTVLIHTSLPVARYGRDAEATGRFYERVIREVEGLPGVIAAGSTSLLPLGTDTNRVNGWTDRQPVRSQDTKIVFDYRIVTPGYFRAMGVPLIAGRLFDWSDTRDSPKVAIVNRAFAREIAPNGDALGHVVTLEFGSGWPVQIVGVVGDYREASLAEEPKRELFFPHKQFPTRYDILVVRTAYDSKRIAEAVRDVVRGADPEVPIYNIRTMDGQVEYQLAAPKMRGMIFAMFSFVALALASLGVYGVIARSIAERRQEIGIRMALGARPQQVSGMLVGEGLRLTALGLAIGLVTAAVAGRAMRGLLYGVASFDGWSLAGAAAVFLLVALVASYLPARRAEKLDPAGVLRSE